MKRWTILLLVLLSYQVYAYCGDGIIDEDETSFSCCVDTGCPENYACRFNTCYEINDPDTEFVLYEILYLVFLMMFIFAVISTRRIYNYHKIRKKPGYKDDVERIRRFIENEEYKGVSEKVVEQELKDEGMESPLIKDAEKIVDKEQKLLDKVADK